MSAPTVFLSAATIDLEEWRNILHDAFMEAGFRVLTQGKSLGMPPRDVKHMLVTRIAESDCVIHLAGNGYGSDAAEPFPAQPDFQCSWTQFEYYHAHEKDKPVIAFVCAADLSRAGFVEEGNDADRTRKTALQEAHRQRVASGKFDGTPLAAPNRRTVNRAVDSVKALLVAVAGSVREVQSLGQAATTVANQLDLRSNLHQLPPLPTGFVGRKTDLDKLRAMPESGTVLTGLRGMGGIGKTALGVVLAHEWAARFPEAQLFLDARGTQPDPPSAGALMASVIQTFHPSAKLPEDEAALKGIYHQVLNGKRVLILVDNAANAAQAAPLIPPSGCALIVTSRQSIVLGTTKPHHVGKLPDDEATALLREYHPALSAADAAALVKLCAGLPLALRVAGAHLSADASEHEDGQPDVTAYIKALGSGRLRTLDADAADAGEITISETLRLSEAQLSDTDRALWRALGVFTASFDDRAAAAVARHSDVETQDTAPAADGKTNPDRAVAKLTGRSNVLDADTHPTSECRATLERLIRRSLLEREGADRYKLHDLAADYARAQLGKTALDDLHLAHARHYTAVGDEADDIYLKGDAVGGLALFDRERAQIEAAYTALAARTDEAPARQMHALVNAVAYTSELRFHPRQRIAWQESQLLAARLVKDKEYEGNALGNLGLAYADLGDAPKAIEYYEQVLVIMREIKNKRGEGNALGSLGNAYFTLGDARKAIEYYEQALAIAREIGDSRGEGNALGNLGIAYKNLGDTRKAIEYHEQALAISRKIGDRRAEGQDLGNLGNTHSTLGEARKAIEYYEQQAVIARELVDQRGEGNALWNSALAYDSLGNRAEAIARAEASLRIHEAIEDPYTATVRAALSRWKSSPEL